VLLLLLLLLTIVVLLLLQVLAGKAGTVIFRTWAR
jgi:hypothetical protein